jgi:hypothetical protein
MGKVFVDAGLGQTQGDLFRIICRRRKSKQRFQGLTSSVG